MKVLATGGAGFVGSATVRYLLQQGHEVIVYDNLSKGHRAAVPAEVLVEGDLAEGARLAELMKREGVEAVMHFAAWIAVGESVEQPAEYYQNNVANTLTLLQAMRQAGVDKIIFSSTAAVYAPSDEPLTEASTKGPQSPYAFSKLAMERFLDDFSKAYGLGYTALRYFNACGGSESGRYGEDHEPESHLIPLVLKVPLGQRESIKIFGTDYDTPDGTCIRDYIHVEDLADAHVRALETLEPGMARVYNIGTGQGKSVLEVIRIAEQVVGRQIATETVGRRPGDAARLVAAADWLRQDLGWKPRYEDLAAIIESAWQWHKAHPQGYNDR